MGASEPMKPSGNVRKLPAILKLPDPLTSRKRPQSQICCHFASCNGDNFGIRDTASAQSYCNCNSEKCSTIAMTRIITEVEKSL